VNDATLATVLQIVAAALLLAEIFLPSGGLLGLATAGTLVGSLGVAFGHSSALGWTFGAIDVVLFPLIGWWGVGKVAKSPLALQDHLDSGEKPSDPSLAGRDALAETGLRPVGRVILDGIRHEARSSGRFVEPGETVRVIGEESDRLLVRPLP
jgi:membrane-bound ClpP family serine protease